MTDIKNMIMELMNKIEDDKETLTDNKYKTSLESLQKLHKKANSLYEIGIIAVVPSDKRSVKLIKWKGVLELIDREDCECDFCCGAHSSHSPTPPGFRCEYNDIFQGTDLFGLYDIDVLQLFDNEFMDTLSELHVVGLDNVISVDNIQISSKKVFS